MIYIKECQCGFLAGKCLIYRYYKKNIYNCPCRTCLVKVRCSKVCDERQNYSLKLQEDKPYIFYGGNW